MNENNIKEILQQRKIDENIQERLRQLEKETFNKEVNYVTNLILEYTKPYEDVMPMGIEVIDTVPFSTKQVFSCYICKPKYTNKIKVIIYHNDYIRHCQDIAYFSKMHYVDDIKILNNLLERLPKFLELLAEKAKC